jgi:hypothetical protein
MSNEREFLSKVLAWPEDEQSPGYINCHWKTKAARGDKVFWPGKAVRTVDEFINLVTWIKSQTQQSDVYMCMSRQGRRKIGKNGKLQAVRSQQDALFLKSVYLDVDVKEPPRGYANTEEAVAAVVEFAGRVGLPGPSAVVGSGSGGVHVYWINEKPLTLAEWTPYARALKAAAEEHGLRCDYGVTTDAARLLRVPGTFNYKDREHPRPVRQFYLGEIYDFSRAFNSIIGASAIREPTEPEFINPFVGQKPASAFLALNDSLADGIRVAMSREEVRACLAAIPNDRVDWIFWNTMGMRVYSASDGESWGLEEWEEWSNKGQVANASDNCASRWETYHTSPPTRTGPGALVNEAKAATGNQGWTPRIQTSLIGIGPVDGSTSDNLFLPAGYGLDSEGYICKLEEVQDDDEAGGFQLIPKRLFHGKLSQPWAEADTETLHFITTKDKGNSGWVSIKLIEILGDTRMFSILQGYGVKCVVENQKWVHSFLMSWMAKLHDAMAAQPSLPFGWMYEDGKRTGFVFGGTIYKHDGTSRPAGIRDLRTQKIYTPTGDIRHWRRAVDITLARKRPEIDLILLSAFAAPLIDCIGQQNAVLHFTHSNSGRGKTSIIAAASATWGDPQRARHAAFGTFRSAIEKMSTTNNLPIYWDDIQDEEGWEGLRKFVFAADSGLSPSRLNSNITQQEQHTWKTLVCITANHSFIDYVLSKERDNPARLYRIFECHMKDMEDAPGIISDAEASAVYGELAHNYGLAGMEYAKVLASDPERIAARVKDINEQLEKEISSFNGEERYWKIFMAINLAAMELTPKIGLEFNVPVIRDYMMNNYMVLRDRVAKEGIKGGSVDHVLNNLTAFFKAHNDATIVTDNCPMGAGKPPVVTPIWVPPYLPPKGFHVQWVQNDRLCRISDKQLTWWLENSKLSPSLFREGLAVHFHANRTRASIAANTQYRQGREPLVDIPVPEGSPLEELLFARSQG